MRRVKARRRGVGALMLAATTTASAQTLSSASNDWLVSAGDPGSSRYSTLDQIRRDNVGSLRPAWIYRTGDAPAIGPSEMQSTPIIVDGVLYTTTPALAVVAL